MKTVLSGTSPLSLTRLRQSLCGPTAAITERHFCPACLGNCDLQFSGFGRYVYVIGNSSDVARYSGVNVRRVKMILFSASGLISALAGLLFAARSGAVRGDLALGFELDIITMVLLGGVSIFGGSGSLFGVLLSILIVLNLRNGMSLANVTGHVQTGVIGVLLILSVLIPNMAHRIRTAWDGRSASVEISEISNR